MDSLCWLRGAARPAVQVDWEGRNGRLSLLALCPQDGTTTLLAVVPNIRGRYASGNMPADELGLGECNGLATRVVVGREYPAAMNREGGDTHGWTPEGYSPVL